MDRVVICHDDFLLVSSEEEEDRKQPENEDKERGKWFDETFTYAEYEADINIPLVKKEGGYNVIVDDTGDVYSMPTSSPKKKSEEENTYYNLDPSPAPSPSTHKKKSVSKSHKPIFHVYLKLIKTYGLSFLFL